jgi:hypothetical protein
MRITLPVLALLCVGAQSVSAQAADNYVDARTLCENHRQVFASVPFPGGAVAANIRSGQVVLEFRPRRRGAPSDLRVVSASHPVFVEPSVRAARQLNCRPSGRGVRARVTVDFNNGGD